MMESTPNNLNGSLPRCADVIVVGAGISGLQAAHKLQQSGISCLVLEASGNVGGQTFAVNSFNKNCHPRTYALASEFDLLDASRLAQGKAMLEGFEAFEQHDQPALNGEDAASLFQIQAILDTLSQRAHTVDADTTVEELVSSYGATNTVLNLVNMWTRTIFGLSSKSVTASHFLSHCAACGGLISVLECIDGRSEDFSIAEPSHQVATAISQRLIEGSVQLNQKVMQIENASENACTIYTECGDIFHATKVVLAGSLSMCGGVQTQPTINAAATWEEIKDEQGFSTTVDVVFDRLWWQQRGLSGHAQGLAGPIAQVHPSGIDVDGLYSLSCQVSGEQARGMWLWLMSEEEREMLITQHLSTIFGGDIPRPVQIIEEDEDPLVNGQQCLNMTGQNAVATYQDRWTPEGNIHFAGAETSNIWRGHMEGALAAGERAAVEVMSVLSRSDTLQMAPRL